MKIVYFRGRLPNFGDELNMWLWPRLLPGFFDDDPSTLFFGIGSIIGKQTPPAHQKIIFGAGYVYGYFNNKPDVSGPDWKVYFVRGPQTARDLNLPASQAVGDAAILLRTLPNLPKRTAEVVFIHAALRRRRAGQLGESLRTGQDQLHRSDSPG